MKEMNEESFLKDINNREAGAFNDLFNNFHRSLVCFSMHYTDNQCAAEDIVQELFSQIWESDRIYASYNSLKTFLYTSARNAGLDYLRHRNIEKKYISYSLMNPSNDEDLELKIIQEELYRLLLQHVEELPPRRQEIFKLYMAGKKNEEIAVKLDISLETVKTAKKESIRYLKEKMNNLLYWVIIFGILP